MVIFKATLFEMDCGEHQEVRDKKYNFSHTKFAPRENMCNVQVLRSVEILFPLSYLSGSGDVMFERVHLTWVPCTGFQTNVA